MTCQQYQQTNKYRHSTGSELDILDRLSSLRHAEEPPSATVARLRRRFSFFKWGGGTSEDVAAKCGAEGLTAQLDREIEEADRGRSSRRSSSLTGSNVRVRDFAELTRVEAREVQVEDEDEDEYEDRDGDGESGLWPAPLRVRKKKVKREDPAGEDDGVIRSWRHEGLWGMARGRRTGLGPFGGDGMAGREKDEQERRDSTLVNWKRRLSSLISYSKSAKRQSCSEDTALLISRAPRVDLEVESRRLREDICDGLDAQQWRGQGTGGSLWFRNRLYEQDLRRNSTSSSLLVCRDGIVALRTPRISMARDTPSPREVVFDRDADHIEEIDPFCTQEEAASVEVEDIGERRPLSETDADPVRERELWNHWMSL